MIADNSTRLREARCEAESNIDFSGSRKCDNKGNARRALNGVCLNVVQSRWFEQRGIFPYRRLPGRIFQPAKRLAGESPRKKVGRCAGLNKILNNLHANGNRVKINDRSLRET